MRSPPQYRMGGEASGTARSTHSTPDPARPASAGMYDSNGRPDRSDIFTSLNRFGLCCTAALSGYLFIYANCLHLVIL